MDNSFITLHTFDYGYLANLAKSVLEAEGIEAQVFSDDGGRQYISLQFVRGAKLMVRRQDAERARNILKLI
jgi:Putative prokaryotic signal transducing protein